MTRHIRTLSLAVVLAATATFADAQQQNQMSRGNRDSFYYGSIHGAPQPQSTPGIQNPLSQPQNIGRPMGRFGPVTPVPEPSQWAMMLAGLALVGFIVRRSQNRS